MTASKSSSVTLKEALEHLRKASGGSLEGSIIACDLDGTLIQSDLMVEGILRKFGHQPLKLFKSALKTKLKPAPFKKIIETSSPTQASLLPYRPLVIELLKEAKKEGAKIILATAANEQGAKKVCETIGLFDKIIASNNETNLKGKLKADALDKEAPNGWLYLGDSNADRTLFNRSLGGLAIGASKKFQKSIRSDGSNVKPFINPRSHLKPLLRAMRPHQWTKNLLLFVPIIAGHSLDPLTIGQAILGAISFSAAASSVYLLNDLLDLSPDRQHLKKCNRPFANGSLSLITGAIAIPLLITLSILVSTTLHQGFTVHLVCYLLATTAYSFKIKRLPVLDVLLLASLYMWRIESGGVATGAEASPWLLGFSSFFFLSLALAKRDVELRSLIKQGFMKTSGRGYKTKHVNLVTRSGILFAAASVLILAFYIHSSTSVIELYKNPHWLWIAIGSVGLWLIKMWQKAIKEKLDGDPVLDAIKEPISYIALIMTLISILLAS